MLDEFFGNIGRLISAWATSPQVVTIHQTVWQAHAQFGWMLMIGAVLGLTLLRRLTLMSSDGPTRDIHDNSQASRRRFVR